MSRRQRIISIIGVLVLLLALMPAFPSAAQTSGSITLNATVYSDNTTFNIATITVDDADLSESRIGKARFTFDAANDADPTVFDLTDVTDGVDSRAAVLSGETSKTDKFDGDASDTTFTLTKSPRDADDDGTYENADVTVVVGGSTLTATTQYTVNFLTKIVTLGTAPAAGTDNVVITYERSEYDQTTPGNTPVKRFGTSVLFGTTFTTATSDKNIDTIDNADGTITISSAIDLDGADNTNGNSDDNDSVIVTFVYDVADSSSKLISVSSPTAVGSGKTLSLTGAETTPSSNLFRNTIALFTGADLNKIESEAANANNDLVANGGDADTIVQVDELDNTSGLGTTLDTSVQAAGTALGLTLTTATGTTLAGRILPVADGDTLTVTYVDTSPSATKTDTASIDLAPPTVTLVQPVDKVYTKSTLVTMEARVVDTGAGVDSSDITLVPPTGVSGSTLNAPIENGFAVSFAPNAAITEGAKLWLITVEDKVGNTPVINTTTASKSARGAAPPGTTAASAGANPFKFTVDTAAPTVASATTGLYLKNPGVTSGTSTESQSSNKRTWIRLLFNLGTGGAPIDSSSVAASDFKVDGAAPISVLVNAKSQESGVIAVGAAVYLEVPEQATDAKPKVELVGEILDKAVNARTAGTISAAADGLNPVLTVTASPSLHEKTVVVTVASSENLVVNPTIQTTTTTPVTGTVAGGTTLTVAAQGGRTWTATYTNPTGGASKRYVVVSGTDASSNSSIYGDDSPAKELVSFEVDDAAPVITSPATTANATEGAVWITTIVDENDYVGDSKKTVTVVSATLDGVDVSSELFSGTTTVADAGDADTDGLTSETHATLTLARTLAQGTYVFKIKVKDTALNESSLLTHTLTVKARAKFEITLNPGMNFISIPGQAVSSAINDIIGSTDPIDAIIKYDRTLDGNGTNPFLTAERPAAGQDFTSSDGLTTIDPGSAYWMNATARVTLSIDIPSLTAGNVLPPVVQLLQGYNGVGIWDVRSPNATGAGGKLGDNIDADSYFGSIQWVAAYWFDPTPGEGWQVLRPDPLNAGPNVMAGRGYYVYLTQADTLVP